MNKLRLIPVFFVLLLLAPSLPAICQKKVPHSNVKEKMKNGKEDPWADYKEEKDSVSRWAFGINVGGYFPSNYSANYYNGSPENINNVNYLWSNTYWYRDISQALGNPDSLILAKPGSYNTKMHYQVAITAGIFLRFNINLKNGIFLQANYTQLKATSSVSIKYVKYTEALPYFIQVPIYGSEERAMLELFYQRSFPLKSKIYFFLNGGAIMCYTHVKKSVLVVEGREYNLINVYGSNGYVPNSNSQEFNTIQYGIGFGGLFGAGVGLPISDMWGLEPGVNIQYYPTNLKGYPDYKPSFSIYLRIMLGFSNSKVS